MKVGEKMKNAENKNPMQKQPGNKINTGGVPTPEDMELINLYARKPLTAEEVCTFTLRAADTRIDRDFERFDRLALEKMAELYVGKTVITDHTPSAENQCARIYRGYVQDAQDGESELILCAYMPNSGNDELMAKLDRGTMKEVSVGCAVTKRTCSVCGKQYMMCSHQKGKSYKGRQCFFTLSGVTDVYEVSFVAVPAQPAAGVVKCRKSCSTEPDNTDKTAELKRRLAAAKLQTAKMIIQMEEMKHENDKENV